jgi:geranylgeranyl pyrophosphate synthase
MAIGRTIERTATRASFSALAQRVESVALRGVTRERLESMRGSALRRPPTVFFDFARDAATAFGDADAAAVAHAPLVALIEAIKIVDDVQDEEPVCLATEIGVDAALHAAGGAMAWSIELASALPLEDPSWRAAVIAIGRGLRETARGQMLETHDGSFDDFWRMVDRKTPPLVATALELGALSAGADPASAAALTRLAIPLGRILQIGDDCHDALGPAAADWRNPALNLLMRFTLSGPHREEVAALLRQADFRAAQHLLLRDGALAYAMHAQTATLHELETLLDELALPDPTPFRQTLQCRRDDVERLMLQMGVPSEASA